MNRIAIAVVLGWMFASACSATVYYSRDEALALAFPDAERIEARNFFLRPAQRAAIEDRAKARLDSDLLTVYVGHRTGSVIGYAAFDTHVVRTLPETFLIVLTADGAVAASHLLAFYEPLEYKPAERWLDQWKGKRGGDDLKVGGNIAAITGSTLTAHAVAGSIRRALAIYAVLLKGE